MKRFIYKSLNFFYILLKRAHHYIYAEEIEKKYGIQKNVSFPSSVIFNGSGLISVGGGTYFGENCCIIAYPKSASIKIGNRCMIAQNVHVRTASYDIQTLEFDQRDIKYENIIIGDNVWIGANVFIKGGVTIGNNVAIGSNSVVTKSFPNDVVIAGVPAKIIKQIK